MLDSKQTGLCPGYYRTLIRAWKKTTSLQVIMSIMKNGDLLNNLLVKDGFHHFSGLILKNVQSVYQVHIRAAIVFFS